MESKIKKQKFIYGPVFSWRLGRSLGIDPIASREKVCSFNCVYCQLGRAVNFSKKRKIYAKTKDIVEEIKALPPVKIDYITFSGMGEPTLVKNLGELIKAIKKIRKTKIAVLTNSSLLKRKDVRKDLSSADFVVVKLDAPSQKLFNIINKPAKIISFKNIIEGIKKFKAGYKGRLGLQIMFVSKNKKAAKELATIAKDIGFDEIQINTPLRPCREKPLSRREISEIKKYFSNTCGLGTNIISAYEPKRKKIAPINAEESLKRRGKV